MESRATDKDALFNTKPSHMTSRKTRDRMTDYRNQLRAQGLRPVGFWVMDTRSPGFAAEIARQCARVRESDREAEDIAFVAGLTDWDSFPPYNAPVGKDVP
jgi:hypothetical protein